MRSSYGLIAIIAIASIAMVMAGGGMSESDSAEMARYEAQLQFNAFTKTYNKRYTLHHMLWIDSIDELIWLVNIII
jgi:hypothetical protein